MTRFLNCGSRSICLDAITYVDWTHAAVGNRCVVHFAGGESVALRDNDADRLSAVLTELEACTEAELLPGQCSGDCEGCDGCEGGTPGYVTDLADDGAVLPFALPVIAGHRSA